ncbi:MAG: hypothetical protein ACK5TH_21520 [Prosthecobacter sp.]|jgi:hypothetical protein
MNTTEPLSAEELQSLKQAMGLTRNLIYFVGGGLAVMLLLAPSVISGLNSVIIIGGVLLTIVVMIWAMRALLGRMRQDIQNGVKLVQIAQVEEKRMVNGTAPAVVLAGEEQLITTESYNSLAVGDRVQLEVTPISRTFIRIQKL